MENVENMESIENLINMRNNFVVRIKKLLSDYYHLFIASRFLIKKEFHIFCLKIASESQKISKKVQQNFVRKLKC